MFFDRADAGRKLGMELKKYGLKDAVLLAIPRGGIITGYEAAKAIGAKFSLIIVRKLPFPSEPEAGFGAISEDGSTYMQSNVNTFLGEKEIKKAVNEQKLMIKKRLLLRPTHFPSIKGKTVILVDDGIAMGSTMIAAILTCKKKGAKKIVVASPVASPEVKKLLKNYADEVIVLETPSPFYAVAQAYKNWGDISDLEAKKYLINAGFKYKAFK